MVNYPISFSYLLVFCHKEPNMPRQQLRLIVQWDLLQLLEEALLCELDFQIYRDQSYGKEVHNPPSNPAISRSLGVMEVWSL